MLSLNITIMMVMWLKKPLPSYSTSRYFIIEHIIIMVYKLGALAIYLFLGKYLIF